MVIIGISDFKRLVSERLSNPKEYANRTLLLWNGHFIPGFFEYEMIEQCCLNYNKSHPDDQVWFTYSDFCFQDDDYSKRQALYCYDGIGYKPRRILCNSGCFMPNEAKQWVRFVNTRANNKGKLPEDCVLIACVPPHCSCNFQEKQFSGNCDIVCLKPSVEEWRQWMSSRCNSETLECLLSFIESKEIEPDYFLLDQIISKLELILQNRGLQFVSQLSQDDFDVALLEVATKFPIHDFWEFIQAHK